MPDPITPQGVETPVTEVQQGATTPVTATETTTPKVETTPVQPTGSQIPQSEWQATQERLKDLEAKDRQNAIERFEIQNPIVTNEKYKSRWEELKQHQATPGHKYAGLDFEDLLRIMRDPVSVETKTPPPPPPVPSLHPSAAPDLPAGTIPQESADWLSMRYSPDQIKATEQSAV